MSEPLHEFTAWPKTPRLLRDMTITEKIDGTNAAIAVRLHTDPAGDDAACVLADDGQWYAVYAQSRKRIITPADDNYGFATWVHTNARELATLLGPGLHYGEWWGYKINRGYGLSEGDRRFSLFNTDKWAERSAGFFDVGDVRVGSVPVLWQGQFDTRIVSDVLRWLSSEGSFAVPGYDRPEGICVFHHASRQIFKVTLDNQDAGKWEVATP